MARHLQIIHTEDGNATVGSGKRYDDGDNYDAGSEISLLSMNNKGIYAEGLFLILDGPRGGVPVAGEIMARRAGIGGRRSCRGNLGWNSRSELAFTGRTGTTEELVVRKGGLVTRPFLPTRTDRESRVGGA